ncbi:FAD-dependent oxidoreductase [Cupriavidus sp. L7L]|uniref:FAD-dependent oxidoreductase n=1 Tax=Cupriavidus sp. L7L TaxID=2546443 RepID=UPI0010561E2E|nr:FAD-dependent oxidoreductase [Cupriavidus sp. L7L]TDF64532.1 3-hydroxyacyl-CoA dehydrogenase [Cupriavidus sp. L7L]
MTLAAPVASSPPVRTEVRGRVLLVTIDLPPVNALGLGVRQGLAGATEQLATDPSLAAMLIVGAGGNFVGGADIREFGKPRQPPFVRDICNRLEASPKLVVAAIQGAALGGGLELALSAHYRLVLEDARIGLPEVLLGLLPGSGGTQRMPRLVGVPVALELMLSGRHVGAHEAVQIGLADRLGEGMDASTAGLAYVEELLDANAPRRPSRYATAVRCDAQDQAAISAARDAQRARNPLLLSPHLIVDAVEATLHQPFDAGMVLEQQLFQQCIDSPQRRGLIYAFFAERQAAKVPEANQGVARAVNEVGVVGGGTMGAAIAVAALNAGLRVTLVERDEPSLQRGLANVGKVYTGLVSKGRMTQADQNALMSRLSGFVDYAALGFADLVIEAAFEDMAVKKAVFAELDRVCKPGAVLATNTSYLDIDEIAATTSRPQDVIGLHFFAPAHIMRLLEVVVPRRAGADVVATAFAFGRALKKVAVRAGVCDGFIGNRILSVYRRAADYMIEDGASPYEIDDAIRGFGYPMGPLQVSDLSGGDIGWATRKRQAATRDPRQRYVQVADRIAERGWFGQKTGRGWYLYPKGARAGEPDPEVLAIVQKERSRAGIVARDFTAGEIERRYLAAMVNEGANVVHEGIALRPLDVDVVFVHGFGFPRFRGGPMFYADTVGLGQILSDIETFAKDDPHFWHPSPLLLRLVAQGRDFSSLNAASV